MRTNDRLEIGDRTTVLIPARKFWVDTGVQMSEGERYDLRADGTWRDMLITSGPEGYATPWYSLGQRAATRWRRAPTARWFALIGVVRDQGNSKPFVIGSGCRATMSATGRLQCFANDVPGFYWNNFGAVQLSLERLS